MTDHSRPHLYSATGSGGGAGAGVGASARDTSRYPGQAAHPSASSASYQHTSYNTPRSRDSAMFDDAPDDNEPSSSSAFLQHPSHGQGQYQYSSSPRVGQGQYQGPTIATAERAYNANMASSLRGKRAPAPAALDLSPPSARERERERVRQESFVVAGTGMEAAPTGLAYGAGPSQGSQNQYSGLGLGMPGYAPGEEKRVMTDSAAQRRASRPLPHPPGRRDSSLSTLSFPQPYRQESYDSSLTYNGVGMGSGTSGGGGGMAVPLPAVGLGQGPRLGPGANIGPGVGQGSGGAARRVSQATVGGSERPSLDSYYFTSDPSNPSEDDHEQSSASHGTAREYEETTSPGFTPVTPNVPDPFTLDRAGLIGTGELATPRWATSNLHPNLRTPAAPPLGLSHSPNVGTPHTAIGMADRGWTTGNDGIGLGVGVRDGHMSTSAETSFGTGMNGLARSPALSHSTSTSNFTLQMSASPNAPGSASASAASKARRERALSHVDSPPKVPGKSEYRGSTGPSASTSSSIYRPRDASLPRLTHAGSFQDFSFDTGMEAAINAAFDSPGAPPSALASSTADITPREYRQQLAGQGNVPQPLKLTDDLASVPPAQYSPNSARARTAARKAERERRISGLQEAAHVVPERSTSKMTPPHSATSIDSLYAARQRDREREKERDSRKTPPYSQSTHLREISAPALGAGGKGKHSPSTSHHHDILRHFAPKDFSHLPPSPSSASINQFLRNSNSTGNFGSSALGGVGIGVGSPSSKTPPTTSTSHVSYFPNTASNGPPTPSHSQAGGNPNASMTSYKSGITRSDSQRSNRLKSGSKSWEGREVDRDTAEAMRKLDGLGSTPKGKAGSRGSKLSGGSGLGSAGHTSRPESPTRERNGSGGVGKGLAPPQTQVQGQGQSERQGSASSPLSRWTDLADETRALNIGMENGGRMGQGNAYGRVNGLEGPVMPAARRESPSTASFEGTPTSRDSTSITTPSSSSARPDLKQRRASVGSDFSTAGSDPGPHSSTGSCEKVGELSVPPVPPLPKGYASMRYGLSNAANSMPPPSTAPIQPAYQPLVDNSYGQIPTPVTASVAVTTPNIHGSPATSSSPASTTDQRPRQMNKKWSFSSAISLRLNRGDSGNANTSISSPPQAYTQASPDLSRTDYDDSSYIWNQTMPGDFSGMSYAPPHQQNQHAGSDTSSATASRLENRSATSITPVGLAPPAPASSNGSASGPSSKPPPTNKRLTPSGIPFFRRTSSSSTQPKQPTPPASSIEQFSGGSKSSLPPVSKIPTSASTNTRKSMLGMHFPSMLRSSGSKRHLSQQAPVASAQEVQNYVNIGADGKGASSGWGRTRGKTMSISGPLEPKAMMPNNNAEPRFNTLRPKASDSSLRSGHSYIHESGSQTLRASKSGLPPISGSPAVKPQASSGSLRTNENQPPQAPTPTRIPRLSSRNPSPAISGSVNSMGPPPAPVAHTMSHSRSVQLGGSKTIASTSSLADFSRPNASASSGVSEFGAMGLPKAHIRNTSNDPQRSRLLAPMSTRNDPKPRTFAKPAEPAQRIERPANIPPSRRTMPLPPSAAAMTISAQAKRVSRDVKPGLSRHSSKDGDSGRNSTEDGPAAIKPSKSLHAKLNVPSAGGHAHVTSVSGNGTRIPSSSSVGAPSVGYRKVSLATTHSETPSPAEDEETLADAEMAAYVSRRKARVAAGTGRKDDLKDIEGFPEDIAPVQPISQRAYISQNLARMTDYERKEALDHDLIYFVPRVPIIREPQKGGATYNYGFDDERGDYLVVEGDHLCYRYEVMGVLGKGSFGQVLECRDHKTGKSVAVKIIRNKKRFHAQAMVETKILGQLVEWDPEDKHYMVCMTDHFNFRSHLCIVTELLSINLYELIKANQFAGFSTTLIRRFTMQMLSSLQLMRSHRIVHCDLKPENILLRHPCKSGIKVIDFGSSCHETEKVYTYIQSRFYRSPEVILGMNYAMAIDMWSLGCILAELYTGVPIFPGENEHEQLACIMEVLGVPDPTIVNKAQRKKLFFDTSGAPRPFVNAKGKRRRPGSKTLAQALKCKDELFIDFISKCLTWDPDRRLKPQPAMRHPWILAGRRRYAPPPPTSSHRLAERASISGSTGSGSTPLASARVVSSGLKSGSTSGSTSTAVPSALGPSSATNSAGDKKQYVISPPTPLVAKNGYGQVPSPAPRLGYGAAPRVVQALNTRGSFIGTSKVSYD